MMLYEHLRWEVSGWRLSALERDRKDLARARKLIARLRAENRALKEDRRGMRNRLVARYDRLGSFPHRYGFIIAAHTAGIPFSGVDKTEARAEIERATP